MTRREPQRSQHGDSNSAIRRLEELLGKLQEHSARFRHTWHAGEATRRELFAGQIGALANGCSDVTMRESAEELEAMLLQEEAATSAMCEKVEALIQLCRRSETLG